MPVPASATSVGASGRSPTDKSGGARASGGTVRQRKAGGGAAVSTRGRSAGGGAGSMWRFYTGKKRISRESDILWSYHKLKSINVENDA